MFHASTVTSISLLTLIGLVLQAGAQDIDSHGSSRRVADLTPATQPAITALTAVAADDLFDRLSPLVKPPEPEVQRPVGPILREAPAGEAATAPIAPAEDIAEPKTPTTVATQVDKLSPQVRKFFPPGENADQFQQQPRSIIDLRSQLTQLSQQELSQLITLAADTLAHEFAGVHYGERWASFLNLQQLTASGPTERDQAQLQMTLAAYQRVARDKQYQQISKRYAFKVLHQSVAEYLAAPEERDSRRAALKDVDALAASLKTVPTGQHWQRFLELQRVADLLSAPGPLTRNDHGELHLILARFEQTAGDASYQAIVQLRGFDAIHRRVQNAVAVISDAEGVSTAEATSPRSSTSPEHSPRVTLHADTGPAYYRYAETQPWRRVDNNVALTSGAFVKTSDTSSARLEVGEGSQLVCSPQSMLQIMQQASGESHIVTSVISYHGDFKLAVGPTTDLSPRSQGTDATHQLEIVYGRHRILPAVGELELDFRHDTPADERLDRRAIAAVYTGVVKAQHETTGDEITIRAGRKRFCCRPAWRCAPPLRSRSRGGRSPKGEPPAS